MEEWQRDVVKWQQERESARYERRRAWWKKPGKPKLEKTIPKPKKADFAADEGEGEDEDEDEEVVTAEEEDEEVDD